MILRFINGVQHQFSILKLFDEGPIYTCKYCNSQCVSVACVHAVICKTQSLSLCHFSRRQKFVTYVCAVFKVSKVYMVNKQPLPHYLKEMYDRRNSVLQFQLWLMLDILYLISFLRKGDMLYSESVDVSLSNTISTNYTFGKNDVFKFSISGFRIIYA